MQARNTVSFNQNFGWITVKLIHATHVTVSYCIFTQASRNVLLFCQLHRSKRILKID